MKKQVVAGLLALSLLAGCSSASNAKQTAACKFDSAEGMDINFTVDSKADTINKINVKIVMHYEQLGYDLSKVSDSIKKSTANSILEQLGLSHENKGVSVNVEYGEEAMTANVEINIEKADSTVLNLFGFDSVSEEDLSFSKFLKDAKESGVVCE